jgi:hypothetical protein
MGSFLLVGLIFGVVYWVVHKGGDDDFPDIGGVV